MGGIRRRLFLSGLREYIYPGLRRVIKLLVIIVICEPSLIGADQDQKFFPLVLPYWCHKASIINSGKGLPEPDSPEGQENLVSFPLQEPNNLEVS